MLKHAIIALTLLFLPIAAQAQEAERADAPKDNHGSEHAHGSKGPHGGVIQDIAGYEGELLTGEGTVVLYLLDHETDELVDTAGMQANILFRKGETRSGTVALKPAGDRLEGAGKVPPGADAVVSLRTKDGKTAQARFELGGHEH